jgi:hypothetical protein
MNEQGSTWQRSGARGYGFLRWSLGLVAVLAGFGCAAPGGSLKDASPAAQRGAVTERANARWAALIKGDLDAAYLFLSPASRQVVTLDEFKARTKGSGLREAKVDSVECEPEVCKVWLSLTYDHRLMKGITTPISESWVIDQGQAWYVWQR